jgi:hypothetical protein
MKKKIKLAILGSCISRDVFGICPDPAFEIVTFVARTSFVSLFSPPLPLKLRKSDILAPNRFERNAIHADLYKTGLKTLMETPFDYLILDFLSERLDLVKFGATYFLDTPQLHESAVLERLPDAEFVGRLEKATTALWEQACAKFIAFLKAHRVPASRIILHESYLARDYFKAGKVIPFAEFVEHSYDKMGETLSLYNAHFLHACPGVRAIAVEPHLVLGDGDHKWGQAPFHYVAGYYAQFFEKFRAIIAADRKGA